MTKEDLLKEIINILENDLATLLSAAQSAHAAATHEECIPDNKYDTTALEASYIAQGQANRAQGIRRALELYRKLQLCAFEGDKPIRMTAHVTLETDEGQKRRVFIGPDAGGMKLLFNEDECVVITVDSPLGKALLGKRCDDEIQLGKGENRRVHTVISII